MRARFKDLGPLVGVGDGRLKLRPLGDELRTVLWSHARDNPLDQEVFGVDRAVKWLEARLLDDPSVDLEVLALGAVALQSWDDAWATSERGSLLCDRLKTSLGSCDAIPLSHAWVAAVALQVLLHRRERDPYNDCLANSLGVFGESSQLPIPASAQISVAFQRVGRSDGEAISTAALIARLESGDPYSAANVVWAAGERGDIDSEQVEEWRDFIADWLNRVDLNRANLVAACACIQALSNSVEAGIRAEVRLVMERVLYEGRRDDGSWYGSPWNTSWALLAAHAVNRVRAIVVSAGDAAELLERLNERLAGAEYAAIHRVGLIRTVVVPALLASVSGLAGVLVAAGLAFHYDGTLLSLLGAGLTTAAVLLITAMWRLYRFLRVF